MCFKINDADADDDDDDDDDVSRARPSATVVLYANVFVFLLQWHDILKPVVIRCLAS